MTATDDFNMSFAFTPNALPSADARIALVSGVYTVIGNLVLRTNGTLCLRNGVNWIGGSVSTACTKTPLNPGTTYHVGLHEVIGTGNDGVLEASIATGAGTSFGTPFVRTTTGTWTTRADRVSVGSTTNTTLDALFDDIHLDGVALTVPAAPTALVGTAPTTSTEADLTWTANTTNASSYVVDRSNTSDFTTLTSVNLGRDAVSYQDTTVASGSTYYYRVKAINAAGASSYTNTATVTTRSSPPAAPTGLVATPIAQGSTRLDWVDNATGETSYVVERSATSSFASVTTIAASGEYEFVLG